MGMVALTASSGHYIVYYARCQWMRAACIDQAAIELGVRQTALSIGGKGA